MSAIENSIIENQKLNNAQLKIAVLAALAGDWHASHDIAQDYKDLTACWLRAVLHKIEGDEGNSHYWYAKAQRHYDDYTDSALELTELLNQLQ